MFLALSLRPASNKLQIALVSALFTIVGEIVFDRPRLPAVFGSLAELPYLVRPDVKELEMANGLLSVFIRIGVIIHRRSVQVPREKYSPTVAVHPVLLPLLCIRIVDVEALSGIAAPAGPVLEDHAIVENLLDAA